MKITSGTGAGQIRKSADNDATVITVERDWATAPDGTSDYQVITYKIPAESLHDQYAERYIETYLLDETQSGVLQAWIRMLNQDQRLEEGATKTPIQDLDYINDVVIALGKAMFDYEVNVL